MKLKPHERLEPFNSELEAVLQKDSNSNFTKDNSDGGQQN